MLLKPFFTANNFFKSSLPRLVIIIVVVVVFPLPSATPTPAPTAAATLPALLDLEALVLVVLEIFVLSLETTDVINSSDQQS